MSLGKMLKRGMFGGLAGAAMKKGLPEMAKGAAKSGMFGMVPYMIAKKKGPFGGPVGDDREVSRRDPRAAMRGGLGRGEEVERAKGGKVKKYAKGGKVSSASKRADGCATKGKTKGRMV